MTSILHLTLPADERGHCDGRTPPPSLAALLRYGNAILMEAGIENAQHEAVWILEAALRTPRLRLWLDGQKPVEPDGWDRAISFLRRRAAREPLQYILGAQEFRGLTMEVCPQIFIPRPETELLVEEVIRHCAAVPSPLVTDIGTGSGCIAVALAKDLTAATIYASDRSPEAVEVAKRNALRHHVLDRITILEGDLLEPLRLLNLHGRMAAVVSNPPYIAETDFRELQPEVRDYEPRLALAGGTDGLAIHRRLLREAAEFLSPGGLLALEVGLGQAQPVRRLALALNLYRNVRILADAAGIARVVCLYKKGVLS
jgi:release factor glutamine methyltransferase